MKELTLAPYYDGIVLNSLRLAVVDAEQGALTPADFVRIKVSRLSLRRRFRQPDHVASRPW